MGILSWFETMTMGVSCSHAGRFSGECVVGPEATCAEHGRTLSAMIANVTAHLLDHLQYVATRSFIGAPGRRRTAPATTAGQQIYTLSPATVSNVPPSGRGLNRQK